MKVVVVVAVAVVVVVVVVVVAVVVVVVVVVVVALVVNVRFAVDFLFLLITCGFLLLMSSLSALSRGEAIAQAV